MASTSQDPATNALNTVVSTATTLLRQLETTLAAISRSDHKSTKNELLQTEASSIDPLPLTRDSAALVKAHSTKISLLIINKPFTPSAITTVLRELLSGPIPGLAAAAQACDAGRYTEDFRRALSRKNLAVLEGLRRLVEKIPSNGKVLPSAESSGVGGKGKGSLAATGLVWEACDKAGEFSEAGVQGFFVTKVQGVKNTLCDIIEELEEWAEETGDSEDEEDGTDEAVADFDSGVGVDDSPTNSPGSSPVSIQTELDDLMNSYKTIPRNDIHGIRPRLECCLRKVLLCALLCKAVVKSRMKKMPAFPSEDKAVVKKLEESLGALESLPNLFGDLAMAFYGLKVADIDAGMAECKERAIGACSLLNLTWDQGKDEFSDWAEKLETEIRE